MLDRYKRLLSESQPRVGPGLLRTVLQLVHRLLIRPSGKAVLLLGMVVLGSRGVQACLNDTSVDSGEREFRSQYNRPQVNHPAEPAPQAAGLNPWAFAALVTGAGLASGALLVTVGRNRRAVQ